MAIAAHRANAWRKVVVELGRLVGPWAFRGEQRADWELKSTLDRSGSIARAHDEAAILERFQRRAGVYLPSHMVPRQQKDTLAWLGLMRHYGAPTRLLDLTSSPYVALFFAFEHENPGGEDRALYAFNLRECGRRMAHLLAAQRNKEVASLEAWCSEPGGQAQIVESLVRSNDTLGIVPAEPWLFDARQTAQQTTFLVQGSVSKDFDCNLEALVPDTNLAFKLILDDGMRATAIADLAQVNVTAASLFPGIDGFGRSMYSHLTLGWPTTQKGFGVRKYASGSTMTPSTMSDDFVT